jgi:hypothetical protein
MNGKSAAGQVGKVAPMILSEWPLIATKHRQIAASTQFARLWLRRLTPTPPFGRTTWASVVYPVANYSLWGAGFPHLSVFPGGMPRL